MVKIRILYTLLIFLLSASSLLAAEAKRYVNGEHSEDIHYLLKDQQLKVEVTTKKTGDIFVQGHIEKTKVSSHQGKSITLNYTVTRADVRKGYIQVVVFFTNPKTPRPVDSFVETINVTTAKKARELENETDEDKAERIMKELGIPDHDCKKI